MKRKIKYLTDEEQNKFCEKYGEKECNGCPLDNRRFGCRIDKMKQYLNKEIEVEEVE